MDDLTADDLACAQMAAQLAIAWHRQQETSDFTSAELQKLTALIKKLDSHLEWAKRYVPTELTGDECVMIRASDICGTPNMF